MDKQFIALQKVSKPIFSDGKYKNQSAALYRAVKLNFTHEHLTFTSPNKHSLSKLSVFFRRQNQSRQDEDFFSTTFTPASKETRKVSRTFLRWYRMMHQDDCFTLNDSRNSQMLKRSKTKHDERALEWWRSASQVSTARSTAMPNIRCWYQGVAVLFYIPVKPRKALWYHFSWLLREVLRSQNHSV